MAVLVLNAAGSGDRAGAAAPATLRLVSFSIDRTILPGRTSTVTPRCRRGFSFLTSRFMPISITPAGARPSFETQAVVPRAKGVSLTFRNTGAATIQIRATADCARISGGASLRTSVASRTARLGARAASAGRARASARRGLAVVCGRRNSIPADIGFSARKNDLVRVSYFRNRKGRIGVRGVFSGGSAERVKLLLSCVQGNGVKMVGWMAGGAGAGARSARVVPRATSSAAAPKIVVRYYRAATRSLAGVQPPTGMFSEVDRRARVPWGSPMPASIPPSHSLAGRGFFDPRQARTSAAASAGAQAEAERGRSFFLRLEEQEGLALALFLEGSELNAAISLLVFDQRILDQLTQRIFTREHRVPPSAIVETTTSKTVGPISGLPNCSLGFFVDVYIPADAREPMSHRILDNDPPCQNATITAEKFPAGTKPPNNLDPHEDWKTHQTYRVSIRGDSGEPLPFRIEVTWQQP